MEPKASKANLQKYHLTHLPGPLFDIFSNFDSPSLLRYFFICSWPPKLQSVNLILCRQNPSATLKALVKASLKLSPPVKIAPQHILKLWFC